MDQIDLIQRMNATLALSLAFQRLDPYQLDQLNETLYTELERFLTCSPKLSHVEVESCG